MTRRDALRILVLAALIPDTADAEGESGLAAAVMDKLAALGSRTAAFVEEKRVQGLSAPLVNRGRLGFVRAGAGRPARLEKLTEAPHAERLVIEGDAVSIATPDQPERTLALDQVPGLRTLAETLRATLAGDLPALSRLFAIEASGSPAQWRLMLVPHDAALRARLARVTLDGQADQLRQITTQTPRETDTLALTPLADASGR